jgi:NAD(P)-dependent dehydrogenase (short-subunit alcohol dehydrogenase family)
MIGPGRNALVVGAGQGIGRAVAEALADAGCLVIAVDIDQEAVESVVAGITGRGGSAVARAVDIARPASVDDLFGWIVDTFGTLDAAANVAGVTSAPALLADVSLSEFRRVTEVNLTGVFLAMQHELRLMLAAGSGAIVNISSAAGIVGVPGAAAYTASKHAVIGLTRSAAAEYIAGGIRINCVAPSHIDTPMLRASLETAADPADAQAKLLRSVPAQRLGSPSDVANAAVFLLSDQAAYLAGSILSVDGGYVAV